MKSVKSAAKKPRSINTVIKNYESWVDTSTGIVMGTTTRMTVSFRTSGGKQNFIFENSKKETAKKVLDSMQRLLKQIHD